MNRHWTFGQKIALGFALSGAVLLVIAVVGYRTVDAMIKNDRLVADTHQVRKDLVDLFSEMKDAETGQRGFVITGLDDYLEPYRAALPQIAATTNDLQRLLADDPNLQRRFETATPLIDEKLAELKSTIEMRRSSGLEPTAKFISGGTGKNTMDQIRTVMVAMDRQEEDLLTARNDQAEASAQTTKDIVIGGSLLGTVLVIIIGVVIAKSLSQQIGSAVQRVQSSSAELQAAANQQVSGARVQAQAMSEIATTINELLATSRQISESGQRVAQIAGQTAAAARAGETTVQATNESIAGIRRQVDLIVNHMLELGKKSQHIGGVLDIVSELSEQTNILAINATIEAAGAGEAGKRFGVVAEEIRKLADRVGGSTKEIRTMIQDVRSAVNTAIMTTETGSKAVDAGSAQFSEVASAFRGIADLVGTTTEAAREIELSTKQQNSAVEQVNVATRNVAQSTKETEVSSSQTLQTASQLADLSKELLLLVQPQSVGAHVARSI